MFWGSEAKKYNYLFESVENQTRSSILTLSVCINVKISTKRTLHSPAPAHQVQISVLRQLLLVSPPASRFIKVSNFNASLRNPEKVNVVQPSNHLVSCHLAVKTHLGLSFGFCCLAYTETEPNWNQIDELTPASSVSMVIASECAPWTLFHHSWSWLSLRDGSWVDHDGSWIMDHGSVSSTFRPS